MREKHVYYAKRTTLLISCCAIALVVMGLFGCTNDNPSQSNPNGISAMKPISTRAMAAKYPVAHCLRSNHARRPASATRTTNPAAIMSFNWGLTSRGS